MEERLGTFSDLLNTLVRGSNYNSLSEAVKDMHKAGIKTSYPTIAAYSNMTSCPTFSKAQEILDFFGFEASSEQIKQLLEDSRAAIKRNSDDSKYITAGIRIPVNKFNEDKAMLEITIKRRAEELLGPGATMNSYITELIRKDLAE